jgi:hypothetical protein
MSISAGLTTSFKEELLLGGHDFSNSGASAGTFCISIYVNSSDVLDENLTAPPFGAEEIPSTGVSGAGGYTAGGSGAAFTDNKLVVGTAPTNGGSGSTIYTSFSNKTFSGVTVTNANSAVIYNATPSGNASGRTTPAIAVLNFNGNKSASGGDFTIQFPSPSASTAIIRIA